MRLIDADALYERTAEWEAQALHMVEVTMNDEDKTEWRKWSAVLAERSAFKYDIADAITIEPERKTGRWIPVTNGRGGSECDKCHNYAPSYQCGDEYLSDYCPSCGAKMEV